MKRSLALLLILFAAGALLTACYEKPEARFYKAGVYQGRTDPLLAKESSPEQQQKLQERLNLVQMDR